MQKLYILPIHKIIKHPKLEGTCKDHQFQLLAPKNQTLCLRTLSKYFEFQQLGAVPIALRSLFHAYWPLAQNLSLTANLTLSSCSSMLFPQVLDLLGLFFFPIFTPLLFVGPTLCQIMSPYHVTHAVVDPDVIIAHGKCRQSWCNNFPFFLSWFAYASDEIWWDIILSLLCVWI